MLGLEQKISLAKAKKATEAALTKGIGLEGHEISQQQVKAPVPAIDLPKVPRQSSQEQKPDMKREVHELLKQGNNIAI